MIKTITPHQFEEIIDLKGTAIVIIGKNACEVEASVKEVFFKMVEETDVRALKINAQLYEEYVKDDLMIEDLPTFLAIDEGRIAGQISGDVSAEQLGKFISMLVK